MTMSKSMRARFATGFLLLGSALVATVAAQSSDTNSERAAHASSALMKSRGLAEPTFDELSALLLNDRFEELETQVHRNESNFARDTAYEDPLIALFEVIDQDDVKLAEKLDQWVKERPTYASYTARGFYEVESGYRRRGERYASETPAENFKKMQDAFEKARPDFEAAIKLNPKFVPAYIGLLKISMALGTTAEATAIERRATAAVPTTYHVRHVYLINLKPRWGGSYPEMQAYEDSLTGTALKNPRNWSLKGESWGDRAKSAWERHNEPEAIEDYTKALQFGDRLEFLKDRGSLYMNARRYDLALKDFERYQEYNAKNDELNHDTECIKRVGTSQACWR